MVYFITVRYFFLHLEHLCYITDNSPFILSRGCGSRYTLLESGPDIGLKTGSGTDLIKKDPDPTLKRLPGFGYFFIST